MIPIQNFSVKDYSICYHGTIKKDGLLIQNSIDLTKCRYSTDFGKGFYVTNNYTQARQWAEKRARSAKDEGLNSNDCLPVVIVFELNSNKLDVLLNNSFSYPDIQWADFIYNCRVEGKKNVLFHEYDSVFGPLADGRTNMLVKKLESGNITKEEFLQEVRPYSLKASQMSFHTEDALDCLTLVEVKEIEME
ncbi:DUF3990 domain-containing protein [Chryseomicrobium sp. FSL W7-1435]|uniref:DUF3990 domain-containing protein n=1 Tax=Chryseomicrobium sp. FSL W7-1435 TaxID=2921704 RepID=UPI00315B084A